YDCSGFTGDLKIPNSVTSIAEQAFYGCSGFTGELRIPDAVTSIGNNAFDGCSGLTGDLRIPDAVTSIGNWAFYDCIGFIGKLIIGKSVEEIGYYTFYNTNFESVYLPASLKTIGYRTFDGKEEFTAKYKVFVCAADTPPACETSVFQTSTFEDAVLYVPEESVTAYQAASEWSNFKNIRGIKDFSVENVFLNKEEVTLKVSESVQLDATIISANTTDSTISWTSSDPEVATVDENGLVTALSVGTATITATTANGAKAECVVTVEPIPVESVELDATEATLRVNETVQLLATLLPENATDKSLTWTSSNPEVATVDENGLVTALSVGTATITATNADGVSADCVVTVEPIPVESVELDTTETTVRVNETVQLLATILPENATDKSLTWTSSNPEVATVDENGLVTALSVGTATITATNADGVSAECVVTVEAPLATSIALDLTEINAVEGSEIQLTATVLPELASEQELIWSTTNENVATVTETGLVTIVAEGNAEIIVTTTDGSDLSATCQVLGTSNVSEIFLTPDATVSIYTMTGTLVKANATKEDFAKLVKGIYIINGKKIMVK
ncbi:MAG: Ig-like domain-containing protein, partial [Muribaculaceae bacterium]|nr:Ig-like domain-containing protein [Muribaculaceae bacterium]